MKSSAAKTPLNILSAGPGLLRSAGNIFTKSRYILLLCLIFLLAEIIVWPSGNFPLNDDWSYTKSVLIFLKEGYIQIGAWPAMTLATNIVWGSFFCKIFGFSFLTLRFSTLVLSLAGILILYQVVLRLSGSRFGAFTAGVSLMFNPYHFNLSNTFMTDIPFCTIVLAALCLSLLFFRTGNLLYMAGFLLVSVAAVLLRQFGLILPVAFVAGCLIHDQRRIRNFLLSLLILLSAVLSLIIYENYLRNVLPPYSAYKFSTGGSETFRWDVFKYYAEMRMTTVASQILLYTSPVALLLILSEYRRISRLTSAVLFFISLGLTWYFFHGVSSVPGNIFANMHLGADTFYETLYEQNRPYHTFSHSFARLSSGACMALCTLTILSLLLGLNRVITERKKVADLGFKMQLLVLMSSYIALLFVSPSYFDRYHLPLIAMMLIFLGSSLISRGINFIPLLIVIVFCYPAVAGTRDYFTVNKIKWQAYNYLTREKDVPHHTVHAGFEPKCWDEGEYSWWRPVDVLEGNEYLVQYTPAPGFKPVKEYSFRRWFPPSEDKIYIFKRNDAQSGSNSPD